MKSETREKILECLANHEGKPALAPSIANATGLSLITVSRGLLLLALEGVVRVQRESRFSFYSLEKPAAKARAGGAGC